MKMLVGAAVALSALIAAQAGAQGTKVSALPSASTLDGTEKVPVVQGGVTRGATIAQVLGTLPAQVATNASSISTLSGTVSGLQTSKLAADLTTLSAGAALGGTELLPCWQGGVVKACTTAQQGAYTLGTAVPALPAAAALTGSEVSNLVQGGAAVRATISTIVNPGPLAPYIGSVGTGTSFPTSNAGSNTVAMAQSYHRVFADTDRLALVFPNSFVAIGAAGAEAGCGGPATIQASIEVVGTGVRTQVTFGGSATGTIANNGYITSDMTVLSRPIRMVNGQPTAIIVRDRFSCPAGGIVYAGSASPAQNAPLGEAYEYGTSVADKTMTGTVANTNSARTIIYRPVAILATTTRRTYAIEGDSIAAGQQDAMSGSTVDVGAIARSVGQFAGYSMLAIPGSRTSGFVASHDVRAAIANAYTTDVIDQHGINDVTAGTAAATIEANLSTIAGYYPAKRFWLTTKMPGGVTSTDNFATAANQTVNSNDGIRVTLNTDIRAGTAVTAAAGYFDLARVLEDPANAGKWITYGLSATAPTGDGTHPLAATGYRFLRDSGEVSRERLAQ